MHAVDTAEFIENIDFMPVEMKTSLVEKLLESLHGTSTSIEKSWLAECDKRVSDCSTLVDGAVVFNNIRAKFQQ